MSLKHAVLTSLLDGDASGYDLAKRMDVSVARWWHALPTQIYAELRRLEDDGLVEGREVPQKRRPTKRVYSISQEGREEMERFTREPARPTAIKDDLLIKIQAADLGAHVQGGIPDEEFGDENGIVTDKGLAQLKQVMPQIDEEELQGKLQAENVMSLFTVQNLEDMVRERASASVG